MKKLKIEDAVGMILGHDVTQVILGKYIRRGSHFAQGGKERCCRKCLILEELLAFREVFADEVSTEGEGPHDRVAY
jgi:hypothetical protein